jgi:DeoR/GlpR family transcriptional regulator of sugar metabolism
MYKEERRRRIQKLVESNHNVSVSGLARQFNVSEMTIRRDLAALLAEGAIERTHGGAIPSKLPHRAFVPSMLDRVNDQLEEKQRIAAAVVKMIGRREKIFLSSGTTTYWVAKALLDRDDLTVIVNSLIIANILAQTKDMEVIVLGGFLRRSELSLMGHFVETASKELRVDKVIMGIRGIHPEFGLTSDNPQELMTDRAMMRMSDNVIVVADHTKFGSVATSRTAPVTAARIIVTTWEAPPAIVESVRKQGVQVIQV